MFHRRAAVCLNQSRLRLTSEHVYLWGVKMGLYIDSIRNIYSVGHSGFQCGL